MIPSYAVQSGTIQVVHMRYNQVPYMWCHHMRYNQHSTAQQATTWGKLGMQYNNHVP